MISCTLKLWEKRCVHTHAKCHVVTYSKNEPKSKQIRYLIGRTKSQDNDPLHHDLLPCFSDLSCPPQSLYVLLIEQKLPVPRPFWFPQSLPTFLPPFMHEVNTSGHSGQMLLPFKSSATCMHHGSSQHLPSPLSQGALSPIKSLFIRQTNSHVPSYKELF